MKLLIELLDIILEAKGKSKVTKTLRQRVYHADYEKTKDKPYRIVTINIYGDSGSENKKD